MNVLLIGGSNSLLNQLIRKMNKEGHRVSVLTGSRFRMEKYERVFERYDFTYDAVNLPEVFTSVSPDVTIFLGAFDSSFRWSNDQGEAVRYVSGLMNLLTAFSALRQGRFVYLSSQVVFNGMKGSAYAEEDAGNAVDYRGMAVTQGEELCQSFRLSRQLDVVTVRLGGYYYPPRSLGEIDNTIALMCCDALLHRRIRPAAGRVISVLNENDSVQFITQLAVAKKCEYGVYQISGGEFTETELANRVKTAFEKVYAASGKEDPDIQVVEDKSCVPANIALRSDRFRSEFGMSRIRDLDVAIGDIAAYMVQHDAVFRQDKAEEKPWYQRLKERLGAVFTALLPFAENFLCFIPFFMLNNRAVGSQYFGRVDFYLLYVLLFAIVHGQKQATVSAILATCGYLFRQMYHRTGFEVMVDYNTYIWIAQIFIIGLIVGYMKDQLRIQRSEAREDHFYMAGQIDDIKEINSSNVRVKDAMQTQIINQSDSIGKMYEITSTLNQYSYEEVLFYAAEILERLMGSKDVAIYTVDKGAYARLFTATSQAARQLGNSVKYGDLTALYDDISQRRVFINKSLDADLPMMAAAIYDGDALRLIVMVWKLPWEKMTLGQADLLAVTGALIQNAALRANRYLEALRSERFVGETPILNSEEFRTLVAAYENACKRGLTVFSLIEMDLNMAQALAMAAAEPGKLSRQVRPHDYLGEGGNDKLYVLLTNTDASGAAVVESRLTKSGFVCRAVERLP